MKFVQATKLNFQSQDNRLISIETTLRNQQAYLQNEENQVGQILRTLSERPQGTLPSNMEVNPREHIKEITLRSGNESGMQSMPQKSEAK